MREKHAKACRSQGIQWSPSCLNVPALFREVDEEDEATPWKEQENWEVDKIKTASMKVGSKDRAKKAQEYDFVFEDQIDFIKDMALAGDVVRPFLNISCVSSSLVISSIPPVGCELHQTSSCAPPVP